MRVTHVEQRRPPLATRPEWAQVRGMHWLFKVWQGFEQAMHELGTALGVPLCVENCGLCCTTNTPAAWGIEVVGAASWLWEQSPTDRQKILDRIENWLVRPVLEVEPPIEPPMVIDHPQTGKQPGRTVQWLEVLATERGRCPLLDENLRCSVYPVRPLGCRAWGITNHRAHWCKRPFGTGESESTDRVFGGKGTERLRALIRLMLETVQGHPKLTNTALFPTALYAHFRQKRLLELLPHIPTAKLTGGQNVHIARLFDEPLDEPLEVVHADA